MAATAAAAITPDEDENEAGDEAEPTAAADGCDNEAFVAPAAAPVEDAEDIDEEEVHSCSRKACIASK